MKKETEEKFTLEEIDKLVFLLEIGESTLEIFWRCKRHKDLTLEKIEELRGLIFPF